MTSMLPPALALALASVLPGVLAAQSYRDYTFVRNEEQPYRSLVQIRAGYKGGDPEGEDKLAGSYPDDTVDGFILYHSKDVVSGEDWVLDGYAGTDGVYLGLKDDMFPGKTAQSRIEVFGRIKSFFREGYYDGDDYTVTGQYEGQDYGIRIGTAQAVDKGLIADISMFYRRHTFDDNDQTALRPDYVIPDDFSAYGAIVTLEQNTLVIDRELGLPRGGSLLTVALENEQNDSDRTFGSLGTYTSTLPRGIWRVDVHAEFYVPNGRTDAWEIFLDGGYYDNRDRIRSFQAERTLGHEWGDFSLGYRLAFGGSLFVKPYGIGQYSRVPERDGVGSQREFFYGGGMDVSWIFGENLALVLAYSYVNNPSRPHIALDEDFYGEHQFFVGMDVSFGSGYR